MAVEAAPAFEFYREVFGWSRSDAHDMGPMGVYQLFTVGAGDIGGMMTKPASLPSPHWNYYFQVDGAQAGADRITDAGGKVVHGPMQVPGGAWIVQGVDPQEATFALVSPTP